MYGCISGSTFAMTAEVLYQISEQEQETNAIVRRWVRLKNIKCNAKEIKLFRSDSTLWAKFSKVNGLQCEVQLHYSGSITHDREQVPESKRIYYTPGSVEI